MATFPTSPPPLTPPPSPPGLTPSCEEIVKELNWPSLATRSTDMDFEAEGARFNAEWVLARHRAEQKKARALVEYLCPGTDAATDPVPRCFSAPPDMPPLRRPSPHSASQQARVGSYLVAAEAADRVLRAPPRVELAAWFETSDILPLDLLLKKKQQQEEEEAAHAAFSDPGPRALSDEDDDSLDILAEAASREELVSAEGEEGEAYWNDLPDITSLSDCAFCGLALSSTLPTYDAAYKGVPLGLGPLHFGCVTEAYEQYHEEQTGRLPATQCTSVAF